jgi:hypothetical protein
MSQRLKRAKNRNKGNNVGFIAASTGSFGTRMSRGEPTEVEVPKKVTGDVRNDKMKGLAKASPFFKKVRDKITPSKEDEKKALAKNIKPIEDKKKKDEEDNDE